MKKNTVADTPACVNADSHLFLGTAADNKADCIRKGRYRIVGNGFEKKTHCKRGHEFTTDNTYLTRDGRSCRQCMVMHRTNYEIRMALR